MKIIHFIILFFPLFIVELVHSQSEPPPPSLISVDVINTEGHVQINWSHPDVSLVDGYIMYNDEPDKNPNPGIPIDTVFSAIATSYIDESGTANFNQVPYKIAAFRNIGDTLFTSTQTDPHFTVFTQHHYDTCNSFVNLSWTPYIGWVDVDYYEILQDGLPIFQTDDTSYTINNLPDNQNIEFSIRAVSQTNVSSSSNIIPLNTLLPAAPAFINADYVTVTDNSQLDFRFTPGPGGEAFEYHLLRLNNGVPLDTLTTFERNNPIEYAYYSGTITEVNTYQLVAECGFTEVYSNLARNIVIQGSQTDNVIELSWNEYEQWLGGTEAYNLYRITNFGTEMIFSDQIRTNYRDDISSLVNDGYIGEIGYYVLASEGSNNPYQIRGESESNTIFFTVSDQIEFPDAITPNGDGKNDIFRPLNQGFSPPSFKMMIFDRTGMPVFESNNINDNWDGRFKNGETVTEGIYQYYIEYTDHLGQTRQQRGRVVVVLP